MFQLGCLINGQSASAGRSAFAGALQDYGAATWWEPLPEKGGIVQSLIQLTDGSAVKITTAHYYTLGLDMTFIRSGLTNRIYLVEMKSDDDPSRMG